MRSVAENASKAYVESKEFMGEPGKNPLTERLAALVKKHDQLEASGLAIA